MYEERLCGARLEEDDRESDGADRCDFVQKLLPFKSCNRVLKLKLSSCSYRQKDTVTLKNTQNLAAIQTN